MNANTAPTGFILSSGGLHMAAKRAFTRARLEDAKPIEKQDAVLTAILFSAAALEAYINETFQIIRGMPALWQSSNKVSAF